VFISTHVNYRQAQISGHMDAHIQCGPKVLGKISFKSKTHEIDTYFFLFKIGFIGIYTGLCAVVQFLKSWQKFLFGGRGLL
jgi:hypothetical protein